MITAWIPENERFPGMYATGNRSGKMQVVTRDESQALKFRSKGECAEWCERNNAGRVAWVPVEHAWPSWD